MAVLKSVQAIFRHNGNKTKPKHKSVKNAKNVKWRQKYLQSIIYN